MTTELPIDVTATLKAFEEGHRIVALLSITVYSEPGAFLRETLSGVAANVTALKDAGISPEQVLVMVVFDGIVGAGAAQQGAARPHTLPLAAPAQEKMHHSMVDYLQHELMLLEPSIMRASVMGAPTTMHMFERTVELRQERTRRRYSAPMQVVALVKARNGGKLNSHSWVMQAFARQLNPKYLVLLDVGTIPKRKAIVHLVRCFEEDPFCGGCCGEIAARNASVFSVLTASQNFEYKIAHVTDKAMESLFGFISVLPGAFSAYRWSAIRGEPLKEYFKAEEFSVKQLGPFNANMHLAEDRVLSFHIVTRPTRPWVLRFVPEAVATTDVPDTLAELCQQRRRWLNGSLFNTLYFLKHWRKLVKAAHPWWRKGLFLLQYCFILIATVCSWLGVSSLYLSFEVIFASVLSVLGDGGSGISFGFASVYALLVLALLIVGLAGSVKHNETFYRFVATVFGTITLLGLVCGLYLFTTFSSDAFIAISVFATFALYALAGLLHGQAAVVLFNMPQYLVLMPTYLTMFTVYSMCRLNDISWGTKATKPSANSRLPHMQFAAKNAESAQRMEAVLEGFLARHAASEAGSDEGDHDSEPPSPGTLPSAVGLHVLGRPPAADGRSVASGGTRQPHSAQDESSSAAGADMMSEADALVQLADKVLPQQQRLLVAKARRMLKAHRTAAQRADMQAARLELEREAAELEFNQFRMTMLGVWIGSNLLFLGIISSFGLLSHFALAASVLILFLGGAKVAASCTFVLLRWAKAAFQRLCRPRCYRRDALTGKFICCCHADDYFWQDGVWEQEQDRLHSAAGVSMGGPMLSSAELHARAAASTMASEWQADSESAHSDSVHSAAGHAHGPSESAAHGHRMYARPPPAPKHAAATSSSLASARESAFAAEGTPRPGGVLHDMLRSSASCCGSTDTHEADGEGLHGEVHSGESYFPPGTAASPMEATDVPTASGVEGRGVLDGGAGDADEEVVDVLEGLSSVGEGLSAVVHEERPHADAVSGATHLDV